MYTAIFIMVYNSIESVKTNKKISSLLEIEKLIIEEEGILNFNFFSDILPAFNCVLIKKVEGKMIIGFQTNDDGNNLLMLLERICFESDDFGFICYYFDDSDKEKQLINYSACNKQRLAWYGQSLEGITQNAIINLRENEKYNVLYKIYKLFCSYELLLSDPESYSENAFGMLNSNLYLEHPDDDYNSLLSSTINNDFYNNSDPDLPF